MVLNGTVPRASACDQQRAAEVFAALASPHRLEIVRLLAERDRDVSELAADLGVSVANASHHLARLRRAGLVSSHRMGTRIKNGLTARDVVAVAGAACAIVRSRS